jgi:hypothetical protein
VAAGSGGELADESVLSGSATKVIGGSFIGVSEPLWISKSRAGASP